MILLFEKNLAMNIHSFVSRIFFLGAFAGILPILDAEEPSRRVTGEQAAAGAQVQLNQLDTSEFPKVTIFATVLKDGVPVPGLGAGDFRVREDEVDQEPITVGPKLSALSVVLTLDTSGSMKKRLSDAQAAAASFLDTLQSQDKAQVIRFSRDVKTIYPMGSDHAAARAAIGATAARGDTALWDALYASLESLRDVSGRKAIVLLSDGVDDDGSGKPLSKHTVTDVLSLARQVNTPIYAIGLGTELDEVNLRKIATESGALYLSASEPSELKRLYDNIGKQLAGQYAIYYTSNLPADGSEHRVQVRYGGITSTKSYVVLSAAKAPSVAASTVKAETTADTPISDKTPSTDPNAPVALNLGEVVKGRLGDSDKTGKYHYWLLDLPAGKYKFVLDLKRADERDLNIGGSLYMMTSDGKEGEKIGIMNETDHRRRSVFRVETTEPIKGALRYANSFTISDYHLGVFRESDQLGGLFFVKPPAVPPMKLSAPVTTPVLEGEDMQKRNVYYSISLPAADYKVSVEFRRLDQKDSNVGGVVSALDEDGDHKTNSVVRVNEIGPAANGAAKLSLADEASSSFECAPTSLRKQQCSPWKIGQSLKFPSFCSGRRVACKLCLPILLPSAISAQSAVKQKSRFGKFFATPPKIFRRK
jgi:VWFA-related protein